MVCMNYDNLHYGYDYSRFILRCIIAAMILSISASILEELSDMLERAAMAEARSK